jgi:hypothetical protein
MFSSYSYDPLDLSLVCHNAIYLYAVKLFVTFWIGKNIYIYIFPGKCIVHYTHAQK